jgi:hypothetical protein
LFDRLRWRSASADVGFAQVRSFSEFGVREPPIALLDAAVA